MKSELFLPVSIEDHHIGELDAPLTLVEFGDFQCPICSSFYPNVERAKRYFGNELTFVFRHYPLMQLHPNAIDAAVLSELAAEKNMFWEAYHQLFNKKAVFDDIVLRDIALSLDINEQKLLDAMKEGKYVDKILNSIKNGIKSKVNGSPNFFLNGKKLIVPFGTEIIKSIGDELENKILSQD